MKQPDKNDVKGIRVKSSTHPMFITSFNTVMTQIMLNVIALSFILQYIKNDLTAYRWVVWLIGSFIAVEWFFGILLCLGYFVAIADRNVHIVERKHTDNKNNNEKK